MRCDKCGEELPLNSNEQHWFSGYGWYTAYHAACCPREEDGWECGKEHPETTVRNRFPALPSSQGPRGPIAGERLWTGDLVYIGSDNKVYRYPVSRPSIPLGEPVRRNADGQWEPCGIEEATHRLMRPIR